MLIALNCCQGANTFFFLLRLLIKSKTRQCFWGARKLDDKQIRRLQEKGIKTLNCFCQTRIVDEKQRANETYCLKQTFTYSKGVYNPFAFENVFFINDS